MQHFASLRNVFFAIALTGIAVPLTHSQTTEEVPSAPSTPAAAPASGPPQFPRLTPGISHRTRQPRTR